MRPFINRFILAGGVVLLFLSAAPFMPAHAASKDGAVKLPGFLQPAPMFYQHREFITPPPPHWSSDVSRSYCEEKHGDGTGVRERAEAAGLTPPPNPDGTVSPFLCNEYSGPMTAGKLGGGLGGTAINPHQMVFAPALYFPLCPIGIVYNPIDPTDVLSAGWDIEIDELHGSTYAGCYGIFDPVAVPVADQDPSSLKADLVLLGHAASDFRADAYDNIPPFLPGNYGPVNLAFEVDPVKLDKLAISVAQGRFFSPPIVDKAPSLLKKVSSFDQAFLLRSDDGKSGFVRFMKNRGMGADTDCISKAFTDNCPACDLSTELLSSADCQACFTPVAPATTTPTQLALNACPKTTTYDGGADELSKEFSLEGTDNPVFIAVTTNRRISGGVVPPVKPSLTIDFNNKAIFQAYPAREYNYESYRQAPDVEEEAAPEEEPPPGGSIFVPENVLIGTATAAEELQKTVSSAGGGAEIFGTIGTMDIGTLLGKGTSGFGASELSSMGGGLFAKASSQTLVVVNRGKIDCFGGETRHIRFRNPTLDANGFIIDTPADVDGLPNMADTQGITLYKSDGTPLEIKPGSPESASCGYLTFYRVKQDENGNPVEVNVAKDAKGDVVKGPAGPNPVSLQFGDYNADGDRTDMIVTNAGFQEEGIAGSLSAVFCLDKTLAPELDINGDGDISDDETYATPCKTGFIVDDTPIVPGGGAGQFNSNHPWWLTSATMMAHTTTMTGMSCSTGSPCPVVIPTDVAITFIDSHKAGNGDFGVFLNDVDTKAVNPDGNGDGTADDPALSTTYAWYNDVNFKATRIDAEPLAAKVRKLASGPTVYPLGIASAPFGNQSYGGWMGLDAAMGLFLSGLDSVVDMPFPGMGIKMDIGTGAFKIRSYCPDLVIGFNNGSNFCRFKNKDGTKYTESLTGCSGEFLSGVNDVECSDQMTGQYKFASGGQWGATYLKAALVNLQTERALRDGKPDMMYKKAGGGYAFDVEIDFTPDVGVILGSPLKIPEEKILEGGAASTSYTLPNDACGRDKFELASVIRDTRKRKGSDDSPFDPGPDPDPVRRCNQRYNTSVEKACCLTLDDPSFNGYKGYTLAASCPSDPMTCCVIQNIIDGNPRVGIDWAADPMNPTLPNFIYNPSADACMCVPLREELLKATASSSPTLADVFKDYTCCMNPKDLACVPPTTEICTGYTKGTQEYECCVKHGGLDGKGELIALMEDEECNPPDGGKGPEICNNFFTVTGGGDVTVNLTCANLCCLGCVNSTCIRDCSVRCDPCSTAFGGIPPSYCNPACEERPDQPGCAPPTGSEAEAMADGTCSCASRAESLIGGRTAAVTDTGTPSPFDCTFTPPASEGPLSMSAASRLDLTVLEGDVSVAPPGTSGEASLRAISQPATSSTITVYAPFLTNIFGEFTPAGRVEMATYSLDGLKLASGQCDVQAGLEAAGGAGSGCSCRLDATGDSRQSLPQLAAALLMSVGLLLLRRRTVKEKARRK